MSQLAIPREETLPRLTLVSPFLPLGIPWNPLESLGIHVVATLRCVALLALRSEASTVDIIVNLVSTTEVLNQLMLVSWRWQLMHHKAIQ